MTSPATSSAAIGTACEGGGISRTSGLLELPEPLLLDIAARLDSWSRVSLSRTCARLNSPAFNAWHKRLIVSWDADPQPKVIWPKNAPPVQTLMLVGSNDQSEGEELFNFILSSYGQGNEALSGVTVLQLKEWNIRDQSPGGDEVSLLIMLGSAFPHLTHLTLHCCGDFEQLLASASQHLKHLTHLDVHNQIWPDAYSTAPYVAPELSLLEQLISLSLVTPDSFALSTDISSLAALVNLQRLELALPEPVLTGLGAIAQACTQLTQLKFACFSDEGVGDPDMFFGPEPQLRARGEVVAWPHLVEAHVLAPSDLLLQLGLHEQLTAPSLQRLHLHIIHTSNRDTSSADAISAAANCSALQQPLVVTPTSAGVTAALQALAQLADKLQHLVLHSCPTPGPADTAEHVLPALAALPQLATLTLAGTGEEAAAGLIPLLVNAPGVARVVIGLGTEHTGSLCIHRAPVPHQAHMCYDVLRNLLQPASSGGSREGQLQLPAQQPQSQPVRPAVAAATNASGACLTATPESPASPRITTAAHTQPAFGGCATMTTATAADSTAGAPAGPPMHIYFGAWCPTSDINHQAVQHNPHYQQLRQLADQSSSSTAPAGRFRLHECDGGSASDMALGSSGAVWLEPHFERLIQIWRERAAWLLEQEEAGAYGVGSEEAVDDFDDQDGFDPGEDNDWY